MANRRTGLLRIIGNEGAVHQVLPKLPCRTLVGQAIVHLLPFCMPPALTSDIPSPRGKAGKLVLRLLRNVSISHCGVSLAQCQGGLGFRRNCAISRLCARLASIPFARL
jgi:hypothetical protein